jgi:hypothetical protein
MTDTDLHRAGLGTLRAAAEAAELGQAVTGLVGIDGCRLADSDPLAPLARDIARSMTEVGLTVHHCARHDPLYRLGGVWWQNMRANPHQTDPLNVSKQFLEHVQRTQLAGVPEPENEWLPLPAAPGQGTIWEHATWITTADLTDGMLRDAVQPESYVLDDRSWSAEERVRAATKTQSDFVALLGPTWRFERLVDRRSLLEELGRSTVKP